MFVFPSFSNQIARFDQFDRLLKFEPFANLLHIIQTDRHECPPKVKEQSFIGAF